MPLLVTALVALGLKAAALLARRKERAPVASEDLRVAVGDRPVGARRPRLVSRPSAA